MPENSNVKVKASSKKRTTVSAEVKLDPKQPIPFELSGNSFYSYEGGQKYIPFLNFKDDFYNILLEAKLLSPTLWACITTRATYSLGEGITINELKKKEKLKQFDPALYSFTKSSNNAGDSLNDVVKEIFDHLDTFGNVFIEIVRGSVGTKKFVKVYVWNTPECRLVPPDDGSDYPSKVIRSKRLLRTGIITSFNGITKRNLLDKNDPLAKSNWTTDKGSQRTVIHLRNKVAGYPCYGLPEFISALTDALVEYKANRYNLDNIENNCSPGGLIGLKGNYTDAEATAQGTKINKQLVGPGKAGRWIVVGSEQGLDGLDVKPFDTKREGSFDELDKKAERKIMAVLKWNKILAGLDDGSALGKGSGYLKAVFDIALKTVIIPRQNFIIENFIEHLVTICDDWMGTKWSGYNFMFKNFSPASFITMLKNIDAAIKRNEVREELNLPTDESPKGDEYLTAGNPSNNQNDPNNPGNPNNPGDPKKEDL